MNHIGNPDCTYNAMHPTLRCSISPSGPCDGCTAYRKASVGDRISRRLPLLRSGNRKALLRIGLEISLGLAGVVVVSVLMTSGMIGVLILVDYLDQGHIVTHSRKI